MTESVLVTGAAGFAGQYLCEYLSSLSQKPKIIGTDIQEDRQSCLYDEFHVADISNIQQVKEIVKKTSPRYIVHLAGTFGTSDVQQIYRANLLSMTAIMEAVLECTPDSIVIATGSAAEYGRVDSSGLPITEQHTCKPVTKYGLSKYLATQTAQYYHRVHGMCTMVVRPFQLIGKGVTSKLAPGAFAKRLLEAKKNGLHEIKVGNLESSRDFLDVRDAVRAIWKLCQNPLRGKVFNLCSGVPTKMSDLLNMMISFSDIKVRIEIDSKKLRGNSDVSMIFGSHSAITEHCGWLPTFSLEESIGHLLS